MYLLLADALIYLVDKKMLWTMPYLSVAESRRDNTVDLCVKKNTIENAMFFFCGVQKTWLSWSIGEHEQASQKLEASHLCSGSVIQFPLFPIIIKLPSGFYHVTAQHRRRHAINSRLRQASPLRTVYKLRRIASFSSPTSFFYYYILKFRRWVRHGLHSSPKRDFAQAHILPSSLLPPRIHTRPKSSEHWNMLLAKRNSAENNSWRAGWLVYSEPKQNDGE